jgi:hypothetical protein
LLYTHSCKHVTWIGYQNVMLVVNTAKHRFNHVPIPPTPFRAEHDAYNSTSKLPALQSVWASDVQCTVCTTTH